MRILQITYFLLLLVLSAQPSILYAQARPPSVMAELSQASVLFGDSVSLTVTARNMDEGIDLTALNADFNVTGRSSSREVSIINGVETVLVNWVIQIEPKQPGVLTVPPISVGNLSTQPLALNVGGPPTGADRVLFIEVSADTQNPYVQSQVLLTIKVWQSINVLESNKVNLGSDQFQTVSLEQDKEYLATRDGKEFLVQEQQFALFPQSSGEHTFGPIELQARIPADNNRVQGFFTPSRTVKRLSQPITFNVQPRPDSVQGQWWLPAKDVQIRDSWSSDPSNINANDTITRTIEVIATGVSGDQLPDIEPPTIDGIKLYADNIDRSSVATDEGIVSTQRVTWAVVPERNGEVLVPPITLSWFNTQNRTSEVAELPSQSVVVNGLAEQASPIVATDPAGNPANDGTSDESNEALLGPVATTLPQSRYPNWLWLLIGALGLLLLQAIGFGLWKLRSFRSAANKQTAASFDDASHIPSLHNVSAAAKAAKLGEFQQAVLQWAQEFWPKTPPNNLLSVAKRLQQPELFKVFTDVDTALYGQSDQPSEQAVQLSGVEKLMQSGARQIVDAGKVRETVSSLPVL